jgi:hypothetical protein
MNGAMAMIAAFESQMVGGSEPEDRVVPVPEESGEGEIRAEPPAPELYEEPAAEERAEPEPPPAQEPTAPEAGLGYLPVDYRHGGCRYTLVFQGVCTHCAHCGQPLSDSVSIERGIGPICSKKGYAEDPKDADEMQAMIDLAEYPALVEFLVREYKPRGVRGLMNGLVRVCSLNRRSPVHRACTDAVESLGYSRLASTLRESVSIVDVKDCEAAPGFFLVYVKKSDWSWDWTNALRRIPGSSYRHGLKGTLVPKDQKRRLWDAMVTHFRGLYARVPAKDGEGQTCVKLLPQAKSVVATADVRP